MWIGNDWRTESDLYTDQKTAFVAYDMNSAFFGTNTIYYADIKAIDEKKTNIIIYHRKGGLLADGWGDITKEIMELVKK